MTHLNYAFANVDPHTGGVVLSDSWADVEIRHPGQGGDDEGLLGNFGVLRSLKRSNRYVFSIGEHLPGCETLNSYLNPDYYRYGDHTQQPKSAPFYRRMVVPSQLRLARQGCGKAGDVRQERGEAGRGLGFGRVSLPVQRKGLEMRLS